jgi:16S rRNA processing protein RimM
VATLGRPVGVRGEIELVTLSDDDTRFSTGATLMVSGSRRVLTLRALRGHHGRSVASFEEVTDRAGADALKGADLVVPVEWVRTLGEDEYWDYQLVGCRVVGDDGRDYGEVCEVLHQPAGDVLVVSTEDGERLVPMVREIVRMVRIQQRRITIAPIPGLLEGDA